MKKMTLCLATTLLMASLALAAPGAHGPNGEHLDGPASGSVALDASPRTETFTENFELVVKLYSTELSVLVDDYKTNAPILNATLALELGDLKSTATFHEDAGDYAFDDPALMKVLQQAGEHEMVFTLTTPTQTDLLLATLNSSGAATENAGHGHGHADSHSDSHEHHGHVDELLYSPLAWVGATIALAVLTAVVLRIRRNRSNKFSKKLKS